MTPEAPNILYVTDLDGTLVADDGNLSDASRSILVPLLSEGLPLAVATARSHHTVQGMLAGVPLTLPVIEMNGAFLTDLASGRHRWVRALEPDVARGVHDAAVEDGLPPFVSAFDGTRDVLFAPPPLNGGMAYYVDDRRRNGDPRLQAVPDASLGLEHDVVCLTIIGEEEPLRGLGGALGASWPASLALHVSPNRYSPPWWWLTVHDARATKEAALRELQAAEGLQNVEVVAFGDGGNDVGLLEAADHAVAVGNADPEVKAVADEVIGTNAEDAVARWIRKDWARRVAGQR